MVWINMIDLEEPIKLSDHQEVPAMQHTAAKARTFLEHECSLNVESQPPIVCLTGIVCTVGNTTRDVGIFEKMMENGMNIARINLSHSSQEFHASIIKNIRTASANYSSKNGVYLPVAIALDTKGCEIRTGWLEGGNAAEVELKKGNFIKVTSDLAYEHKCSNHVVYVDYENIQKVVKQGTRIYIDGGLILLTCQSISGSFIACTVEWDAVMGSHKAVNLPGVLTDLPSVSDKDKADLLFAVEQQVDMIFASFIRNVECVREIRDILGKKGKNIMIVSKIEDQEGIINLESIVKVSDGILVGRGDLGVEISLEKLFLGQKLIVSTCNKFGKPVICARQMMDSMAYSPIPTRAEASDVANAVLDGVDCIMLTKETVKGIYPVETLRFLSKICKEAEAMIWQTRLIRDLNYTIEIPTDRPTTLSFVAVEASIKCSASAIFVITESGRSAQLISKYRPRCPIIAITRNSCTARQIHLYRGVMPYFYLEPILDDKTKDIELQVQSAIKFCMKRGFVSSCDPIIIISEWKKGAGVSNAMRVTYVAEVLDVVDDVLYIQ